MNKSHHQYVGLDALSPAYKSKIFGLQLIFSVMISIFFLIPMSIICSANNIRFFDLRKALFLEIDGGDIYSCNSIHSFNHNTIATTNDSSLSTEIRKSRLMCPFRPSFANCMNVRKRKFSEACISDEWYCKIRPRDLCDGSS